MSKSSSSTSAASPRPRTPYEGPSSVHLNRGQPIFQEEYTMITLSAPAPARVPHWKEAKEAAAAAQKEPAPEEKASDAGAKRGHKGPISPTYIISSSMGRPAAEIAGKKAKLKGKYADQDEEERKLKMELLASAKIAPPKLSKVRPPLLAFVICPAKRSAPRRRRRRGRESLRLAHSPAHSRRRNLPLPLHQTPPPLLKTPAPLLSPPTWTRNPRSSLPN